MFGFLTRLCDSDARRMVKTALAGFMRSTGRRHRPDEHFEYLAHPSLRTPRMVVGDPGLADRQFGRVEDDQAGQASPGAEKSSPPIGDHPSRKFAPCPLCKQYSHSIGEDQLAQAFNHFHTMYSHRGDGIPTQFCFPMETRDAAQILMAAARCDPVAQGEG